MLMPMAVKSSGLSTVTANDISIEIDPDEAIVDLQCLRQGLAAVGWQIILRPAEEKA